MGADAIVGVGAAASVVVAAVGCDIGQAWSGGPDDGLESVALVVALVQQCWIGEWARSSRETRSRLTDAAAGTADWGKMTAVAADEGDDAVAAVAFVDDAGPAAMATADEIC